MVPVHKRDSKANAQHYRPVSLLSVMSKVMESIINSQIMNHLERYGLLSPNQFGFRRTIGAADLLTSLHHEWVNAVSSGRTAHVVAIDIAGAFDRVSHLGLLSKARSYGIRGCLLNWLSDYLHERTLQAVVGGQISDLYPSVQEYRRAVLWARHSLYSTSMMLKTTSPIKSTWPFMQTTPRCTLLSGPLTPYQTLQSALEHMEEWGKSEGCPLSQRNRNCFLR